MEPSVLSRRSPHLLEVLLMSENLQHKKTGGNHYGNTGIQQAERDSMHMETLLSAQSTGHLKRCPVP